MKPTNDHYNRKARLPLIIRLPHTVTESDLLGLIQYMQNTTGTDIGIDTEVFSPTEAIGYLTVIGGPFIAILASPAYAAMVEAAAEGALVGYDSIPVGLPPGVELVRVEWPGQSPQDGWPAIEWQEEITLEDGSKELQTRSLARMS